VLRRLKEFNVHMGVSSWPSSKQLTQRAVRVKAAPCLVFNGYFGLNRGFLGFCTANAFDCIDQRFANAMKNMVKHTRYTPWWHLGDVRAIDVRSPAETKDFSSSFLWTDSSYRAFGCYSRF
jgi:hypothetical protein